METVQPIVTIQMMIMTVLQMKTTPSLQILMKTRITMMMVLVIMKTRMTITMVIQIPQSWKTAQILTMLQTILRTLITMGLLITKKKSLVLSPTTLILMGMVLATFTTLSRLILVLMPIRITTVLSTPQMRMMTGMAILMLQKMNQVLIVKILTILLKTRTMTYYQTRVKILQVQILRTLTRTEMVYSMVRMTSHWILIALQILMETASPMKMILMMIMMARLTLQIPSHQILMSLPIVTGTVQVIIATLMMIMTVILMLQKTLAALILLILTALQMMPMTTSYQMLQKILQAQILTILTLTGMVLQTVKILAHWADLTMAPLMTLMAMVSLTRQTLMMIMMECQIVQTASQEMLVNTKTLMEMAQGIIVILIQMAMGWLTVKMSSLTILMSRVIMTVMVQGIMKTRMTIMTAIRMLQRSQRVVIH